MTMQTIKNLFVASHSTLPAQERAEARPAPSNISPTTTATTEGVATFSGSRNRASTLRRLASLPGMRTENWAGSQSGAQIAQPGALKPESSNANLETPRITEAEANVIIDEAANVLRKVFKKKYLVPVPTGILRKLIIHKYAKQGKRSNIEIAEHLNTTPERAPPQPPKISRKARRKFHDDKADRKREIEARQQWLQGLSDDLPSPFDDFRVPDDEDENSSVKDDGRESLERLREYSGDGDVPLQLMEQVAKLPEVSALLSHVASDRRQKLSASSILSSKQKLRAVKSSIDLSGSGIDLSKRTDDPGRSGSGTTVEAGRIDSRFPDAPPVPFLHMQSREG
jgi:hypothetical protein